VTGRGIAAVDATEIEIGTEIGTETAIGTETGTETGTGTGTDLGTVIGTGTGSEIAHHAETVESAVRVGAVSSSTDLRAESSGNNPRTEDSKLRTLRPVAVPTRGHRKPRQTRRNAKKM
jgi:hypothetical protein